MTRLGPFFSDPFWFFRSWLLWSAVWSNPPASPSWCLKNRASLLFAFSSKMQGAVWFEFGGIFLHWYLKVSDFVSVLWFSWFVVVWSTYILMEKIDFPVYLYRGVRIWVLFIKKNDLILAYSLKRKSLFELWKFSQLEWNHLCNCAAPVYLTLEFELSLTFSKGKQKWALLFAYVSLYMLVLTVHRSVFKLDELGKEIAEIAIPAALALAADPVASLIDTAFIGHIGLWQYYLFTYFCFMGLWLFTIETKHLG